MIVENERNQNSGALFKAIIKEGRGVEDVCVSHHLVLIIGDRCVGEYPSVDSLIVDHKVAKKIWGDGYRDMLVKLALEPVETRDALLAELYNGR